MGVPGESGAGISGVEVPLDDHPLDTEVQKGKQRVLSELTSLSG